MKAKDQKIKGSLLNPETPFGVLKTYCGCMGQKCPWERAFQVLARTYRIEINGAHKAVDKLAVELNETKKKLRARRNDHQ